MTADDLPAVFASLPAGWRACLPDWDAPAQERLLAAIRQRSGGRLIGPPDPFRALRLVPPEAVRVVVFGQDPYPTPAQADGLAFSAERSSRPSLRRIFEVLEADRPGWQRPRSGRLEDWAAQGVLLLNPALTVELGRKQSHLEVGWQRFTAAIVQALCRRTPVPVFLLWGQRAHDFFQAAKPAALALPALYTRHPANDFGRTFMAGASHFAATADLIDWWRIGAATTPGQSQPAPDAVAGSA